MVAIDHCQTKIGQFYWSAFYVLSLSISVSGCGVNRLSIKTNLSVLLPSYFEQVQTILKILSDYFEV